MGSRYEPAVLSMIGRDGFPLSIRLPMSADRRGRSIAIDVAPAGVELRPGPACVTAHEHDPELRWTRNFQVRGDLACDEHGWLVVPHRTAGGFDLPPPGSPARAPTNTPKTRRSRKPAARGRAQLPRHTG